MFHLYSPAKVNLFLYIVGKMANGYHSLVSQMQAVSLADTLSFSLSESDSLTCSNPTLPTDCSNLVLKAVNLFRRKTGLQFGVKIHLEKRIPMGGGLGGGSSNAATTLWGLNELLGRPATEDQLRTWSAEIGSDIPFFFSSGSALITGRGEEVVSVPFPHTLNTPLWIICPNYHSNTAKMFSHFRPTERQERDPSQLKEASLKGSLEYFNDFETILFRLHPEQTQMKESLYQLGFNCVTLSGSGSAYWCIGTPSTTTFDNGLLVATEVVPLQRKSHRWYTL